MVSKAHQTLQYGPGSAMPVHDVCGLTISFNCFSRLSARWPWPWPDCAVAAILQLEEVDVGVDVDQGWVCAKEFSWLRRSKGMNY